MILPLAPLRATSEARVPGGKPRSGAAAIAPTLVLRDHPQRSSRPLPAECSLHPAPVNASPPRSGRVPQGMETASRLGSRPPRPRTDLAPELLCFPSMAARGPAGCSWMPPPCRRQHERSDALALMLVVDGELPDVSALALLANVVVQPSGLVLAFQQQELLRAGIAGVCEVHKPEAGGAENAIDSHEVDDRSLAEDPRAPQGYRKRSDGQRPAGALAQ
jgi:hypothetical protein